MFKQKKAVEIAQEMITASKQPMVDGERSDLGVFDTFTSCLHADILAGIIYLVGADNAEDETFTVSINRLMGVLEQLELKYRSVIQQCAKADIFREKMGHELWFTFWVECESIDIWTNYEMYVQDKQGFTKHCYGKTMQIEVR